MANLNHVKRTDGHVGTSGMIPNGDIGTTVIAVGENVSFSNAI
jgi:hypothetical protein